MVSGRVPTGSGRPRRRGAIGKNVAGRTPTTSVSSVVMRPGKAIVRANVAVHLGREARGLTNDPLIAVRVELLNNAFGGTFVAQHVGVNRSQPTRWAKGDERPGATTAPMLIDLEHVLTRASLVWGETAAKTWLKSPNAYLSGARPIDALKVSGPAPVLEALDAETWGGAA